MNCSNIKASSSAGWRRITSRRLSRNCIKQFVDRRGGGLLWLGGRGGLADGGWERSALTDLLPVNLPNRKETFQRDPANVELDGRRVETVCLPLG